VRSTGAVVANFALASRKQGVFPRVFSVHSDDRMMHVFVTTAHIEPGRTLPTRIYIPERS
jgi:hypothetical protein